MEKLILMNHLSPGDIAMLTACVRDLHLTYPGKYLTDVRTSCPDLWINNPYITKLDEKDMSVRKIQMHYPLIHRSNQVRKHFINGFREYLSQVLKINIKPGPFKPDIHLTEYEKTNPIIKGDYWIIVSGGKNDFTAKWWDPLKWQKVVDLLKDKVKFVQVGAAQHYHPRLKNVIDMVGKTSIRDLLRLIYHSRGVCCIVTCLMHFAAAFDKPCVVVAGGREPYWWEAYPGHKYLHTIGKLDCCKAWGCWKSKVVGNGHSVCKRAKEVRPGVWQPECLTLITPEMVAGHVLEYENRNSNPINLNITVVNKKLQIMNPPITICTLLYGDYFDYHKRCLDSIINNTDLNSIELRIGCNEVCKDTLKYIDQVVCKKVTNVYLYIEPKNKFKYPLMRRIFNDNSRPLQEWVIWFDDDSFVTAKDWLERLAEDIKINYPKGFRMWGKLFFMHLRPGQLEWIQQAKWYRGKPLSVDHRKKLLKVDFITGSFWAIHRDIIKQLDWPDTRIRHNGGDVMLGEALRQNNWKLKDWLYGVIINCDIRQRRNNSAKRRGYSEKPAGAR